MRTNAVISAADPRCTSVHLTNESSATAFNVGFGVEFGGTIFAWKSKPKDQAPIRLNMIEPTGRFPQVASAHILIPDEALFSMEGDPDKGRVYRAYYQSPSGEWWYTRNPSTPGSDLTVNRVRSKRWNAWSGKNRRLDQQIRTGSATLRQAIRELSETARAEESDPQRRPDP
jgi:hypothetical protein